ARVLVAETALVRERGARLAGKGFRPFPHAGVHRFISPRANARIVSRSNRLQRAAADLIELDRLEQRAEIAFAEALVALALDDLEEDRADHRLGEDLEQQVAGRPVEEDPVAPQPPDVLAV